MTIPPRITLSVTPPAIMSPLGTSRGARGLERTTGPIAIVASLAFGSLGATVSTPQAQTVNGSPSTSASSARTPTPDSSVVTSVQQAIVPAPSVVHAIVNAALRTLGLTDDASIDDLVRRARSSGWVPELRLRAYRSVDIGARLYQSDTTADRVSTTDASQLLGEVRLSWKLDRIVFADEEVAIERVKLDRAELRQRTTSRVIDLVVRWSRAHRTAVDAGVHPVERAEAQWTATETLLALDAITRGEASSILGGRGIPRE